MSVGKNWGRGHHTVSPPPIPGAHQSLHWRSQAEAWAQEQKGENSREHNLEIHTYVYISIYM